MIKTISYILDEKHPLFSYLDGLSLLSNNLYNATTFYIRQVLCGVKKDKLTDNEQEVFDCIKDNLSKMNATRATANKRRVAKKKDAKVSAPFVMPDEKNSFLSWAFLCALFLESNNPDFCSELPRQSAQDIVKRARKNFVSFFAAKRAYKKDPKSFTGEPKLPGYRQSGAKYNIIFTNQDCAIRDGRLLKFPKTKETLDLGDIIPEGAKLRQVEAIPYYGKFKIAVVIDDGKECPEFLSKEPKRVIGIDFGVNNLAAVSNNIGEPGLLFKGGAVKARNQWYNKKRAQIIHGMTAGHKTTAKVTSKSLDRLSAKRKGFMDTTMHTIAKAIIAYCLVWRIDTIVMGINPGWKQGVNMGDQNNQNFVSIPFSRLQDYIRYLAKEYGIHVINQEESYTSKASFLDMDDIPVYGEEGKAEPVFSGVRVERGLYRAKDGKTFVNADLNGAANIIRKALPQAFDGQSEYPFFQQIIVR